DLSRRGLLLLRLSQFAPTRLELRQRLGQPLLEIADPGVFAHRRLRRRKALGFDLAFEGFVPRRIGLSLLHGRMTIAPGGDDRLCERGRRGKAEARASHRRDSDWRTPYSQFAAALSRRSAHSEWPAPGGKDPRAGSHGRSAYRIVWISCSIVGDS